MKDQYKVNTINFPWWVRLQLFFKRPTCGIDFGALHPYDVTCMVCMKSLRGVYYVTEMKPIPKLEVGKAEKYTKKDLRRAEKSFKKNVLNPLVKRFLNER